MVLIISSLLVKPAVKTAIGVHRMREPLLYDLPLDAAAAWTQVFYVGSSSINNGEKA